MYSIKIREDLEFSNELISLNNQVDEIRLYDKLGKQNYHEKIRNIYEPPTDTIKNTTENLTKTITEKSSEINIALEHLNSKLLEVMNDRGILAS